MLENTLSITKVFLEALDIDCVSEKKPVTEQEILTTLAGVHPVDKAELVNELSAIGFSLDKVHFTLFIQLEKMNTIHIDVGERELILDDRQVKNSITRFLRYLPEYFMDPQDFVLTDDDRGCALIFCADSEDNECSNILKICALCDKLQSVARREYCLSFYAAIGERCSKLEDYERQYEQLTKRLNSGKMLFPDKSIYWGHSIILGSLVFHTSKRNREKIALCILENILKSSQASVLMETLFVLFECNLDYVTASKRLFIHRNTLLYRIKKSNPLQGLNLRI